MRLRILPATLLALALAVVPTEAQDTAFTRVYRSNLVGDTFNHAITYLGWRSGTDPNRSFGSIGLRLCADVPEGK